jgi:hypothetical protein
MDYSLAVGFDEEKQEMYIGIIGKFSSSTVAQET